MAIAVTTLNGTDSIASSRITINDNFATIEDALNDLLAIIDIATGKINNFGYGSNNDIETEDLIIRGSTGGGISVISGNIAVSNGNVSVSGFYEIGSGSNVKLEKIIKNSVGTSLPTYSTFNMSGTGITGGAATPVTYLSLPRVSSASTLNDIQFPQIGSIVYDETGGVGSTGALMICIASGVTGIWKTVSAS
jgi:hypothetical protein